MNYDKAYELVQVMRDSDEYKNVMEAQKKLEGDETSLKMVRDFLELQMQWEYSKIANSEEEPTILKRLQEFTLLVNENSAARDFLQAYTVYMKVSQDIYRIISEPITEGMKVLEK